MLADYIPKGGSLRKTYALLPLVIHQPKLLPTLTFRFLIEQSNKKSPEGVARIELGWRCEPIGVGVQKTGFCIKTG